MAENNEILQDSDADLLYTGEGHVYDGLGPIIVNNDNDTISLDPIAITKLRNSTTTRVTPSVNAQGNTQYTIEVTEGAGRRYTGEYPVQVNNSSNTISVNRVGLELNYPLIGVVDSDTLVLGAESDTRYYESEQVQTKTFPEASSSVTESNAFTLPAGYRLNGQFTVSGVAFADMGVDSTSITAKLFYDDPDYTEHVLVEFPLMYSSVMRQLVIPATVANNFDTDIALKIQVRGVSFQAGTWTYLLTGYTEKIW